MISKAIIYVSFYMKWIVFWFVVLPSLSHIVDAGGKMVGETVECLQDPLNYVSHTHLV